MVPRCVEMILHLAFSSAFTLLLNKHLNIYVLFICLLSLVVLVVARQKLYTSSYLLEATSYFFCYCRGSNIPILSNSLAKCLSSKNYNLSAFWKRSDHWKFTSLQSCVSFDLAPQIGWKLYILLPAMLLHGPEMWGGWPSCSIWLGCQADDLWPQSLHHHLRPRLPRLACRNCWVKWSSLFLPSSFVRDILAYQGWVWRLF